MYLHRQGLPAIQQLHEPRELREVDVPEKLAALLFHQLAERLSLMRPVEDDAAMQPVVARQPRLAVFLRGDRMSEQVRQPRTAPHHWPQIRLEPQRSFEAEHGDPIKKPASSLKSAESACFLQSNLRMPVREPPRGE